MDRRNRTTTLTGTHIVGTGEVARLSDADRNRFLELVSAPPGPTPTLRRAARRHRELISRSV